MGLALSEPIVLVGADAIQKIAFLDNRRILVIYVESGDTRIRVVDVISRDIGDGSILTRGGKDLITVDNNKALIIYNVDAVSADPPFGQFCRIVNVDGLAISGFGSEATISTGDTPSDQILCKIQTNKAFVVFEAGGFVKARVVNISGSTASPQTETTLATGTVSSLNTQPLEILETNSVISSWSSTDRIATLTTVAGSTVTVQDQKIVDTSVTELVERDRGLVAFGNIFATSYKKIGIDKITAGTVVNNTITIGSPLNGIQGDVMATFPGDKFVAIEELGDSLINQISAVGSALTDDSVSIILDQTGLSISPIGNCVAISYFAFNAEIVVLTTRAQFYQGSGPFGGAGRLLKTADLQIPGVKPNAIDVSSSGLAVLGANAGAPCQEVDVVISANAPYADWDNQSKNYPTGSAVTSVKFV